MAYRNLPDFLAAIPPQMIPPFVKDIQWIVEHDKKGFTPQDWEYYEQMYMTYAKRVGDGARFVRDDEEKRRAENNMLAYDAEGSFLPFLNALMHTLSFLKYYASEKNESLEEKMAPKVATLSRI